MEPVGALFDRTLVVSYADYTVAFVLRSILAKSHTY